jgi:CHAT domain-containing protein
VEAGSPDVLAERAFGYIEQAKSRGLRDLVLGHSDCGNDPTSEVARLREELNWFYHRIESEELGQSEAAAGRIGELREEAKGRERQLARLVRESSAASVEGDGSGAVSLEAIRGSLPADTALVEYFLSGKRVLAAMLTRKRLDVLPVTEISRAIPSLRMLQFQISRISRAPETASAAIPAMQVHLRNLDTELVAPLRAHLGACRRLIIVPHDVLHYVPFQALMEGDEYLIDSYSIAYAPSASVFALCRARPRTPATRSLILGVPDAKAVHIKDEVLAIADLLPEADLYLGEQATAAVLQEKGPSSRFIHIATHGHFRQDNPLFSSVRLGDRHLNVYDLYHLRLPAELITLSGCMTGMNALTLGDELLGLQRGLLQAGAHALLLTMWNVNDSSTSQWMQAFLCVSGSIR